MMLEKDIRLNKFMAKERILATNNTNTKEFTGITG
jgi:hypothetical protein